MRRLPIHPGGTHGGRPDGPGFRGRGFSLIELVLVLSVIAVLAGLAAPRFAASATRGRVEAAATRVITDCRLAQHRARASSADYFVVFAGGHHYTLTDDPADNSTRVWRRVTDLGAEPYDVSISVVLDHSGDTLTYNGFGLPNAGGTIEIGRGAGQVVLAIDPITGEVRTP